MSNVIDGIKNKMAQNKVEAEAAKADQAAEEALMAAQAPETEDDKQEEKPAEEKKEKKKHKIFTKKRLIFAGKVAGIATAIAGAFVAGRVSAGKTGGSVPANSAAVPEAPAAPVAPAQVSDPTVG